MGDAVNVFLFVFYFSDSSFSISSIVGRLFFKFSGIAFCSSKLLTPIGLFISLNAYSTSIESFSLHNIIPIVGLSDSCFNCESTADI